MGNKHKLKDAVRKGIKFRYRGKICQCVPPEEELIDMSFRIEPQRPWAIDKDDPMVGLVKNPDELVEEITDNENDK